MKDRIVNFIRLLRDSNVRISIAESIEACKALQIGGITNKQIFKIALRTTLVKRSEDLPVFDRIFDLYFAEPTERQKQQEQMSEQDFQEMLEQMQQQMQQDEFQELNSEEPSKNNKSQSPFPMENENFQEYNKHQKNVDIYKQGTESDLQQTAKELANSRNFEKWEADNIDECCSRMMIQNDLEFSKCDAKRECRKSQQQEVEERYDKLKQLLKNEIEKAMVKQFGTSIITDIIENNSIMDRDLGSLSEEELKRIQDIIKKIAKKLATHVSRKEKHSKKGKISIRKTIRSSINYGNTSSELKFKSKKRTKSELVVLCDISGSVWMYVKFMLMLVIGIQNVFSKVNSYIFIDNIKNVTDKILESKDLTKTVEEFINDYSLGYGTDYGNVFKQFADEEVFNKKTILIIIGDAENTGKTIGDDYLKIVSDQCKSVYWLDPQDPENWDNPYSELEVYKKHCKEVYECSTLRHLEDFIKKLIKI
jgi:uncharacterized protein with von Willebrand factor type A (vWA) domain